MQPDQAVEKIENWRQQFERDGFLALSGYFSSEEVDRVVDATEHALETRGMEVVVDSLRNGQRSFYAMAPDRESRLFKFNDLYLLLEEVRAIALQAQLSTLLRALLGGKRPVICNSLTFYTGSSQPMHIDSLYMTPATPQHLVATWMAFEDVDPKAGPLVYYPGSHQIPLYKFSDGGYHARQEEMPAWNAYIEREMAERGIEKKIFLARKGDLFIWHADLVHGGSVIVDLGKTRLSLVCHYFAEEDLRPNGGANLRPLNDGFWQDRCSHEVRTPPDQFNSGHPFPEEAYLRRHPDVSEAVANGVLPSAFEHYRLYGFSEGRAI
ncbi:MAG: phytanoyl-CoA dioxygenase family protein [Chthoniobacterales bacterium]